LLGRSPMSDVAVPIVPREVLFGNPERTSPRISPDGSRLAWLAPDEGVLNVWVGTVGGTESRVVTRDRDRGIRSFYWAHDRRHLLYVQDKGGDENWRLYDVDLETDEIRDLTPFEEVQARVEELDKRFPDHVLVGLNRDNPELHDVYRLDLRSGELEKVTANPGFVALLADAEWKVRAAIAPTPDGGLHLMVRDSEDAEWRRLLEVGQEDALSTEPVDFTLDGTALYAITSLGANAGRLVRIDCGTGDMDVIAEDPTYDVTAVRLDPDTREPQVVVFLRDRADYRVLDPAVADDVEALLGLSPGDPFLVGHDDSDGVWLVAYTLDDGPVRFYAWDRQQGRATFLFEHQPALAKYQLAKMEPFSFAARDGLTIHGYLTFPPGLPAHELPTVLNVHGGPWARDAWGFDPEAQWLANRGYLCVQVNFRGSTGYGKAFVNAGDKEWGAKMHDDLLDAVQHVVDKGWADRDRVAIYGGSYGGYAALAGAAFTPEVFRCAVDIVGPSNLKTLIESIPPYWAPLVAQFHTRVGNPETEEGLLWERSPLSKAEQIRIPLLIAQGANDPRVKQAESEQIVAALREQGIDHEYLLYPDEGHGFAKPENRLAFYAAAERFLSRHLGGRAED
ncbi:MAG TPA: S9 family peptidase, partial [Acidimicrobiales bacterium]|nr:S9 family peptidase [Acidimicrobiales bacterium]